MWVGCPRRQPARWARRSSLSGRERPLGINDLKKEKAGDGSAVTVETPAPRAVGAWCSAWVRGGDPRVYPKSHANTPGNLSRKISYPCLRLTGSSWACCGGWAYFWMQNWPDSITNETRKAKTERSRRWSGGAGPARRRLLPRCPFRIQKESLNRKLDVKYWRSVETLEGDPTWKYFYANFIPWHWTG